MNFWNDFSFFTNDVIRFSGFYTELDYSFPIYRARKSNFKNHTDIKELTYLRKENCVKTGRANVPYHPVFYGSFDPACALAEVDHNNEGVILSEWQWRDGAEVSVKLFARNEHNENLKKYNIKTREDYIKGVEKIKGPIEKNSFLNDMINSSSYLSDLFLFESDYFASSILGFEELYRTRLSSVRNTDAIIYPSIALKNQINIALHPEIVDEFLVLKKVWSLNSENLNASDLLWQAD
jgi:hypothetical protein